MLCQVSYVRCEMNLPVVALLFGGPSEEYEISLRSAAHILEEIDPGRF